MTTVTRFIQLNSDIPRTVDVREAPNMSPIMSFPVPDQMTDSDAIIFGKDEYRMKSKDLPTGTEVEFKNP